MMCMVAQAFNLCAKVTKPNRFVWKGSLIYKASSRPAEASESHPVSKINK